MQIQVVQIWGFLMTVLGWVFVACTLAMDGWMSSSIGGMGGSSIVKVIWYWSSLWKTCLTDSTSVSKCYDLGTLWSVEGHLQVVRGLLVAALSLGMLGFVLSLLGMQCTVVGGKERSKHRKTYSGGLCHIISGLMSACGYAVYVQYVLQHYNPDPFGLEYELGTPVFLGWVGSVFHVAGGGFYLWSVCELLCGAEDTVVKVQALPDPEQSRSVASWPSAPGAESKSDASSVSQLSSKPLSSISSRSGHTYRTRRSARTGSSPTKTGRAGGSVRSRSASGSRSNGSASSTWSRSRSVSSLSGSARSETKAFPKTSYI